MKTRRGILALLTAGLLVAGTHASFAQQAPEGCDVPAADLEPPDIPEGYSGVVRIVTVNGRYNRDLSTAPADIADGAPVPTSVLSTYNWGPDCSGQVRFVFLVERPAEGEDDPRVGPVEGDPEGPVIDEELLDGLDEVWDEAVGGEFYAPGERDPETGFPVPPAQELTEEEQDILDQPWDDVVEEYEQVDRTVPGLPFGDVTWLPVLPPGLGDLEAPDVVVTPTSGLEPAAGADEPETPAPEEDPEPALPNGPPPTCGSSALSDGSWSLSYFGESGSAVKRYSGALSWDDENYRDTDLWDDVGQEKGFDPDLKYPIRDFTTGLPIRRDVQLKAKDWERAILTVQYTCGRKTWVVQYELIPSRLQDGFWQWADVNMLSATLLNP